MKRKILKVARKKVQRGTKIRKTDDRSEEANKGPKTME